jgi:hypothetical protein
MNDQTMLTGVVAALLNERELVINLGSDAGTSEGMRFAVLEKQRVIVDPLTKQELGHIQREKVRVKVIETRPKFAIARTYETYQTQPSGARYAVHVGADRLAAFIGASGETRVRTLRDADRPSGFERIDESESYVEVGDPVRLLSASEQEASEKGKGSPIARAAG